MTAWPGLAFVPPAVRAHINDAPSGAAQLALTLALLKQPRHVLCVGDAALDVAPWLAGLFDEAGTLILVDADADRLSTLAWTLTMCERAHVAESWHGDAEQILPRLEYAYDLALVATTSPAVWEQAARRVRLGGALVALDVDAPAPPLDTRVWLPVTLREHAAAFWVRARDATWLAHVPRPLLALTRFALGAHVWAGDEDARVLVHAAAADMPSPPLVVETPHREALLVCGLACEQAQWPSGARWLTWGVPPFPPLFAFTDEMTVWAGVVP